MSRIAVLTHNYPRFPGDFSGNFVAALSQELTRQGAAVSVIAPWDQAFEHPVPPVVSSDYSLAPKPVPRLHLWRYAPRDHWHRLGYMRTMQADIRMRGETYWLAPMFFAAGTAATLGWCRTWRPDLIHAHWLLPNGFFGAIASKVLDIPLVVSIPGSDALVAGQNPLFRGMARFALNQASLVTANSQALRDVAVDRLGADPARFDLIIYGVDPDALRPDPSGTAELRRELGIPQEAFLLLAVGRMVHKKGFDVLLRAVAVMKRSGLLPDQAKPLASHVPATNRGSLADIRIAFVGDGDLLPEWQVLAHHLGVDDRVLWLGRLPFDQMGRCYNAADALVMPSVTRPADGLNVCVLDAMACGKPVIGTTAAGNELVIRDGINGYVVPEGNPPALARAILQVASMDHDRRAVMGAASRHLVETEFGWPHLARRYLEHFRRLAPPESG